jgi:hypothetical protein
MFVCDAFDAMIAERPYAPAMPVEEALRELSALLGHEVRSPDRGRLLCSDRRAAARNAVALAS